MSNIFKPQVGDIIGGKLTNYYFLVLIVERDVMSEWYLCLNLLTGQKEILGYFNEMASTAWEIIA